MDGLIIFVSWMLFLGLYRFSEWCDDRWCVGDGLDYLDCAKGVDWEDVDDL